MKTVKKTMCIILSAILAAALLSVPAMAAVGSKYDAYLDFNTANAGPEWFYEIKVDGGWQRADELQSAWGDFMYVSSIGALAGIYGAAGGCVALWPNWQGPYEACIAFVAPESGTITIAESRLYGNTWSDKGNTISVVHNDKVIWMEDYPDMANVVLYAPEFSIEVKKGDTIRFVAKSLDDESSIDGLGENGVTIWETLKITQTTVVVDSVDSNKNDNGSSNNGNPKTGDAMYIVIAMIALAASGAGLFGFRKIRNPI